MTGRGRQSGSLVFDIGQLDCTDLEELTRLLVLGLMLLTRGAGHPLLPAPSCARWGVERRPWPLPKRCEWWPPSCDNQRCFQTLLGKLQISSLLRTTGLFFGSLIYSLNQQKCSRNFVSQTLFQGTQRSLPSWIWHFN